MMAIGALEALRGSGLRVPEDVAVAGFDDMPLASHLGLTTVRVRIAELGERAIERLLAILEGGEDGGAEELHAPELVVRASTVAEAAGPLIDLDRRQLLDGLGAAARRARHSRLRAACAAPRDAPPRLLRGDRAAHVPLLLGHGEPQERAGARPLADAVLLEHRRGRLRASRLCDRRRARLVHAGRSARPDADDAALLLERAAGAGAQRDDRPQGLLLSLPRYGNRRCAIATSSCRASTPRSC